MTKTKIQVAFGIAIREIRQSQGLSQEKFALRIGMDRTYYASVEAGHRNISINNIERIAHGLGIPLSELFLNVERKREVMV